MVEKKMDNILCKFSNNLHNGDFGWRPIAVKKIGKKSGLNDILIKTTGLGRFIIGSLEIWEF